jgi:chromosome segregation ATPase
VIRFACRIAAAVVFGAGLSCVSHAADPRYPDWPCVQAKVPDISVAAVWDGPPIEQTANTWQNEPEIKDLVARLAARRTPMEDAQRSIAQFLAGDPAAKADRGKRLFAGLFETLNSQRTEIMNGLERLARKEKELAEQIKSDASALHELQDKSAPDQSKIDELAAKVGWSTRIFDDRRRSIRYACEVPIIIEKRLFALSRAIQRATE